MQTDEGKFETEASNVSGVCVIKVTGDIDMYSAAEFRQAIKEALDPVAKDLIVDLTGVEYMDSSGFGALLGATRITKARGGQIVLVGCNEAITRMLNITRLDLVFPMSDNCEMAVDAVRNC